GNAGEVSLDYDKTTRTVDTFKLSAGYKGSLDFASRPTALDDPSKPNPFGQHRYSIGVGRQILRDGQPWDLNWQSSSSIAAQETEMFDALKFTYAPELKSTQKNCKADQSCRALRSGNSAAFGARPLGIYFYVADITSAPAASTPSYLYGFKVKLLPS